MKKTSIHFAAICSLALVVFLTASAPSASSHPLPSPAAWPASAVPIARVLSYVARQYSIVYDQWLIDPTAYPNYGVPSESTWRTLSSTRESFTNGFFPGRFMYLVEQQHTQPHTHTLITVAARIYRSHNSAEMPSTDCTFRILCVRCFELVVRLQW